MNYGKQFFPGKKGFFKGEELNFLRKHQATTADKLFVFRGSYIQEVT